jgi:hypothetical protein
MTPTLPLGHELEAEWRFRVIHERNLLEFLRNSLKKSKSLPASLYKREGNSGFSLSKKGSAGSFFQKRGSLFNFSKGGLCYFPLSQRGSALSPFHKGAVLFPPFKKGQCYFPLSQRGIKGDFN